MGTNRLPLVEKYPPSSWTAGSFVSCARNQQLGVHTSARNRTAMGQDLVFIAPLASTRLSSFSQNEAEYGKVVRSVGTIAWISAERYRLKGKRVLSWLDAPWLDTCLHSPACFGGETRALSTLISKVAPFTAESWKFHFVRQARIP